MIFLEELYDFVLHYKRKNTGLRVFLGSERTIKTAWRCALKYAVEGDEVTKKFVDINKLSTIMLDKKLDDRTKKRIYIKEHNKQYQQFRKKFLDLADGVEFQVLKG